VTYREAEYDFIGIVVADACSVSEKTSLYQMARSSFEYRQEKPPDVIEVCKVFWFEAAGHYMEYVHDLEVVSEGW
jgi:hypothetical protein